ncbi:MAG TPA: DNA repair protein RadC [Bacillota bacterium]|nr:DNA repair protein RadC [Bacillota bacterium]
MPRVRRIHQMPLADRPREKLQHKGAASLSDFELWEVVIGAGVAGAAVGSIAKQMQRLLQKGADAITLEALLSIKGVSTATAAKILASLELARRHLVRDMEPLRTQQDILSRLQDIRNKKQEYFVCLSLDGGQRLISQRTITIGTLDSVQAHPREVFADAIADRAASILVAHNHPSGDPQPSRQDITLTQQLHASGQLLGVPLQDHLIVTRTEHFSCRQHHLL